jgi:serine/threonine protein kinase
VRADLEFGWRAGRRPVSTSTANAFPNCSTTPSLAAIAFEWSTGCERRIACIGGVRPPSRYRDRRLARRPPEPPPTQALGGGTSVLSFDLAPGVAVEQAQFPPVGETFLGFRLTAELGRGSLGRVYLAEQGELAGRLVALKLSRHTRLAEPQTLARLQHTHIVPVYSVHRSGPFEAVCMPFLGRTTLADLLRQLRGRRTWPESGRDLADTVWGHGSRPDTLAGNLVWVRPASAPVALTLERLSVEAVLWIGSPGGHKASARGIIHRLLPPTSC